MTDPRYTDPRHTPLLAPDDGESNMWGWIAGISILALIAFVVIAGWNGDRNSASNDRLAPATSAQRTAPPVGTTGSGGSSPSQPMTPAPAPRSGTQ